MFGLFKKSPAPKTQKEIELQYLNEVYNFKIPEIRRTYNEIQYKELLKEVFSSYASQSLTIVSNSSNVQQIEEVIEILKNQLTESLRLSFNNSTYASKETEREFYQLLTSFKFHIDEIATDRIAHLYQR